MQEKKPGGDIDFSKLAAGVGDRPRTASAFVESALRAAIVEGRVPGGTVLRQEALAEAFGVSRMPVREALRQLEAQALIEFSPHKGAVVANISAQDAIDAFVIRRALEPVALSLSIPNLTPSDIGRATDLILEMDEEPEHGRLGELNRRFHMSLYVRAGHPKLVLMVEQQLVVFDRYLRFFLAATSRDHLGQNEHRTMLAAAEAGDVDAAVATLTHHLDTAARGTEAFLRQRHRD